MVAYQLTDPDNWDSVDGWTKRELNQQNGDFLPWTLDFEGDVSPGKHRLFYPSRYAFAMGQIIKILIKFPIMQMLQAI